MVRQISRREVLIWCRKMLGPCETKNATEIDELLQAGVSGRKMLTRIQVDGSKELEDLLTNEDDCKKRMPKIVE